MILDQEHALSSFRRLLSSDRFVLILIFLASSILLFWKLGDASLGDDESVYAQVARETARLPNWLTLYYQREPWFHKPPLFIWSTATLFRLFEVSEYWTRVSYASAGVVLIIVTYHLGKILYGRFAGILGAGILLSSYIFVQFSRIGMFEIGVTLFIYLCLYSYLRISDGGERWWVLVWLFFSLAFMTKSFAALFIVPAISIFVLSDSKIQKGLRSSSFIAGVLLAAIIVLPWHLYQFWQHGESFITQYLGYHILARATTAIEGNTGDTLFYVRGLQGLFYPWVYILPFAIVSRVGDVIRNGSKVEPMLTLALVILVIVSLIQTKLHWYLFPVYPSFALLIAAMIQKAFTSDQKFPEIALLFSSILLLIFGSIHWNLGRVAIIFILLAGAIIFYSWVSKKSMIEPLLLLVVVFFFVASIRVIRFYFRYQLDYSPMAQIATMAQDPPVEVDEPLLLISWDMPPVIRFYSNRLLDIVYTPENLEHALENRDCRDIILREQKLEELSQVYNFKVLDRKESIVYALVSYQSSCRGIPLGD